MSIIAALTEKPWLTPGLHGAPTPEHEEFDAGSAAGVFVGVFFGVVTVLFALVTAAYLMRMGVHGPMGHGGGDWARLPEPPLLWVNTGVLILSSLAWLAASGAAKRNDRARMRLGLILGGILAITFIAGQILVWRQLDAAGYYLAAHAALCTAVGDPLAGPIGQFLTGNPAVAFFYLITALHGLHLLGGLAFWAHTTARVVGGASAAAVRRPVELTARYWHFLLLVWLLMFGLLLMT